ncbi:type II secretion system F family protein [Caulobacter vibrioides]|uniref:Type II secretion system F family protein n=1 Tax=Caulobacter vibrioides TaxID=155892 RepID=A0A290MPW9_CAUVI|nr:type II secretion system F family protein [Caulobacter vibrioides]ATC30943.1 type II secretion system F family protein [Caulobacter vibrioides]
MSLVETLTNPSNVLTAFIAVVVFATIITLASPVMRDNNLEGRLKSVANRREELRRRSRQSISTRTTGTAGGSLRHQDEGLYKNVVDRLQLSRLLEDPKVVEKLAQAGFRGPKPVSTFYFFRFAMPFAFAAGAAFYLYLINDFGLLPIQKMCACVAFLAFGYYAPNVYITNVAQKRRESIVAAFPDALDLLLICVESGMSIEAAIQKVGAEVGASSMELAEELSLLTAELSYLPDRRLAYENLARRTNHPGIKSVATAMIQAERYGTPLGTALRVMAKENRELRLSAAEKKAAALPAQLTVPMILFFLPVLFVMILGPAIMKVQDAFK